MKHFVYLLSLVIFLTIPSSLIAGNPRLDLARKFYEDTLREQPRRLFKAFSDSLQTKIETSTPKIVRLIETGLVTHEQTAISTPSLDFQGHYLRSNLEFHAHKQATQMHHEYLTESEQLDRFCTVEYCIESLNNDFPNLQVPSCPHFDVVHLSFIPPPETEIDADFYKKYRTEIDSSYQDARNQEHAQQSEKIEKARLWVKEHPLTTEIIRQRAASYCVSRCNSDVQMLASSMKDIVSCINKTSPQSPDTQKATEELRTEQRANEFMPLARRVEAIQQQSELDSLNIQTENSIFSCKDEECLLVARKKAMTKAIQFQERWGTHFNINEWLQSIIKECD